MNQTELLGLIIQRRTVTSGEVADHFGIPVHFAHQVLRRLEEKGLLTRKGGPYRFEFELSSWAKDQLDNLTGGPKDYGWVFLVGLAALLIIGLASSNKGDDKDESKRTKNQ